MVLDATSLERNLPLGLQIMELTENVIFCLNLTDEAEKRGISVDDVRLERLTGVPVIKMAARQGVGLRELKEMLLAVAEGRKSIRPIGIAVNMVSVCSFRSTRSIKETLINPAYPRSDRVNATA